MLILQEALIGAGVFGGISLVLGLWTVFMSRDGIFLEVWAGLFLAGLAIGAVLGGTVGAVKVVF